MRQPTHHRKLRLNGSSIPVLRILSNEDHQKCNDGRACVDNELPRVGEAKQRTAESPCRDDQKSDTKCERTPRKLVNCSRNVRKSALHSGLTRRDGTLFRWLRCTAAEWTHNHLCQVIPPLTSADPS